MDLAVQQSDDPLAGESSTRHGSAQRLATVPLRYESGRDGRRSRLGRNASVSPAAGGALAFGVERQSPLQPVVCRSLTARICPASYADLATGFTTNRGAFSSDIGMTTRSALITRKQLNPYEEAKAVRA
ncbi:MAG: hypothetical protein ACJ743_09715, partial [Gaiellaceae bacterium]